MLATLCLIGFGFGWPLGHPSATQGPCKRGARASQGSIGGSALFATKLKKGVGVGAAKALLSPESRVIARDRKTKNFNHKGHEGTRRRIGKVHRGGFAQLHANLGRPWDWTIQTLWNPSWRQGGGARSPGRGRARC